VFGHGTRGWQNWSGSKTDLDVPIPAWRLHDFRRSMSTTMHERLGVLPHICESCLGHVGGHLRGVAGTYNQSSYIDYRRIALTKWADHIMALVTGERPSAVVTPLHRTG
jgi:hypothetical protein